MLGWLIEGWPMDVRNTGQCPEMVGEGCGRWKVGGSAWKRGGSKGRRSALPGPRLASRVVEPSDPVIATIQ